MTDLLGLKDEPVLVVGGGFGIGRETALLLAKAGARVAVADVDPDRAGEVAREVKGHAVMGDITDESSATSMVDDAHEVLGGLTRVINIVGLASWGDILSMDVARWEQDIRMNLTHHLFVGRAAARHMLREGGGAMAFVASVSGIWGAPNHAAYGAAKAGVIDLVRSMAAEWGAGGIRVNCVAPDVILTPRLQALGATAAAPDDRVPLGRMGTPAEIAGPLVFLVSQLASFLTGQCLIVDGGTHAQFPHSGTTRVVLPEQ